MLFSSGTFKYLIYLLQTGCLSKNGATMFSFLLYLRFNCNQIEKIYEDIGIWKLTRMNRSLFRKQ